MSFQWHVACLRPNVLASGKLTAFRHRTCVVTFGGPGLPSLVHPDPLLRPLPDGPFEDGRAGGGEPLRFDLPIGGVGVVGHLDDPDLVAVPWAVAAAPAPGHDDRRPEAEREVARGPRRECRPAEEGNEEALHPGVLVDEEAERLSLP